MTLLYLVSMSCKKKKSEQATMMTNKNKHLRAFLKSYESLIAKLRLILLTWVSKWKGDP